MTTTTTANTPDPAATGERADLQQALDTQRGLLCRTIQGLRDDQARERSTVSELCLGGLVKHVTLVEGRWCRFIEIGPDAMAFSDETAAEWAAAFTMAPDETLAGLLEAYAATAGRTAELIISLPDLDATQPLPPAPWFAPGATWSARRVLAHILSETAQHCGHADILREAIDGQKSMG